MSLPNPLSFGSTVSKARTFAGCGRIAFAAVVYLTGSIPLSAMCGEMPFPNGSFEDGALGSVGAPGTFGIDSTSVPGWRIFAVEGASGRFSVSSTTPASQGKNVLIVERAAGGAGDTAADTAVPVEVESGRVYKVLADVKAIQAPPEGGETWATVSARLFGAQSYRERSFVFQPTPAYETAGAAIFAEPGFSLLTARLDTAGKSGQAGFDNVRYEDVTTEGDRMINGGFENSTTRLIGWRYGSADGGEGSAALIQGEGVGGSGACLFSRSNSVGDVVLDLGESSQRVPVRPEESLALDFDAKRSGENDACKLRISVMEYDSNGEHLLDTSFLFDPERDGFSHFHEEYTPVAGAAFFDLSFRIFEPNCGAQAVGSFYLDNISVKGIPK